MKLSLKYWTKHKIKAFLIIASIAMCTAALTCMAFLFRSVSAMEYNLYMDTCGDYDAVIPHATDEGLRAVYGCENVEKIGVLYNGGHCRAVNDVECLYGAFEDEQAVKMFHYWPERGGRYPQKSGEITGYKTTFEEMGVAPAAGNIINLEISDSEGNEVFTREFTIVGVLNDQRNQYDDLYREFYEGDYEYPKLFIHKNDLPDNVTMTVILTCKPNVSVDNVVNELRGKSVFAYDSGRLSSMMSRINVMAETGNELNERLRLASKDFYSSKIVPVFCVIVSERRESSVR